jgi:MarR family transcriptional regulator, 2-MHQ and catechol-resistance regulon repressor
MTFQVPKDRADQVAGLLMRVGDRLARLADRRLASWKMGESDYNVLRILNGSSKPLTQIEIGRKLLCSRANVTKIVDRLEERKMVRRRPSDDRRENHIEITAQGVKFLRETILEVFQLSHESLSPLTHRQLLDLEKLLLMLVRSIPDLDRAVHGGEQPRRSDILALSS